MIKAYIFEYTETLVTPKKKKVKCSYQRHIYITSYEDFLNYLKKSNDKQNKNKPHFIYFESEQQKEENLKVIPYLYNNTKFNEHCRYIHNKEEDYSKGCYYIDISTKTPCVD